jgi:CheY-like chemotaxis protein
MKKVLVVEDDESFRSVLLDLLSFEGYEAIEACNGREGLLSAQKHQPHLIICDLMMPGMNGFEVIRELRQDSQTASIPVIILSAFSDEAAVQQGLQLGAVAYLTKPYSLDEFLAAIRSQIGEA